MAKKPVNSINPRNPLNAGSKPDFEPSPHRVPWRGISDSASRQHNAEMDRLKQDPMHIQKLVDKDKR